MVKLKKVLAGFLPGIFLIGYNVGTGSVASMSKAGANFGLDLLWTIVISCLITYYLISLFSKFTMQTGETFIQGIKNHIHPGVAVFLIVALSIIILSALIGLIGILAEVMEVGTNTLMDANVSRLTWAITIATGLYLLLLNGNYSYFEKILAVLVGIMGVCFIATAFINFPSAADIVAGLVPKLPEATSGSDNSAMIILAGMVGTTVSVFVFIIRSQIVQEKGWNMRDMPHQRKDALISVFFMFVISTAIMITAASTLHVQGIKMNNIVEMIPLLEPLAGRAALAIFVLGIFAAGLSSHLPNLLVIPWLIIDYTKSDRNVQNKKYRILLLLLSIISILGVAFGFKSIFVLMLSQACIAIVLPLSIAAIFYLTSRKDLMKNHMNSLLAKGTIGIILVLSIYISFLGINGLISDIINIKW